MAEQECWAIAKMTARCARYGCPENLRESLAMPTATFPEIAKGLLLRSIVWKCVHLQYCANRNVIVYSIALNILIVQWHEILVDSLQPTFEPSGDAVRPYHTTVTRYLACSLPQSSQMYCHISDISVWISANVSWVHHVITNDNANKIVNTMNSIIIHCCMNTIIVHFWLRLQIHVFLNLNRPYGITLICYIWHFNPR